MQKKIPSANDTLSEAMQIMNAACIVNFDLHMDKSLINTPFFRNWDRLVLIGQAGSYGREAVGRTEAPGGGAA